MTLAAELGGGLSANNARAVLEEQSGALADRLSDLEGRAAEAKDRLRGAATALATFYVSVLD